MLSMLKRVHTAVHILTDSTDDTSEDSFSWEEEPILTLNVNDLCAYVPSLPGISWGRLADLCVSTVSPVFQAVKKTLADDVEHLTQLMAELDAHSMEDWDVSVCETAAEEALPPVSQSELPQSEPFASRPIAAFKLGSRRQYHDPELDDVLTIPSTDPSIPTIIVTPCPSLPRDTSCLVPYQDVSFGNRLAVPFYPVVNEAFPPLLPKPAPFIDRWRFKDGHWWAVLPAPEEQSTRGMFSRPLSRRRRMCVDTWSRHVRSRRVSVAAAQSASASRASFAMA